MTNDFLKSNGVYPFIPLQTRWVYQFQMLRHFITNKGILREAMDMLGMNFIDITELKLIEDAVIILEEFAVFIHTIEADKTVTISEVLLSLVSIRNKISKKIHSTSNLTLKQWLKNILLDMEFRFEHVTDPQSPKFNVIYSLATFLDPRTFKLMYSPSLMSFRNASIEAIHRHIGVGHVNEKQSTGKYDLEEPVEDIEANDFKV